jgi:TolB protein
MQRAVNTTEAAADMQQVTRSQDNELDPAISPDGKSIAYEVTHSLDRVPHVEAVDLAAAVAGRGAKVEYSSRAAMGLEPAWMPDGSSLVFVSDALGSHEIVETIGPRLEDTRLLGSVGDPTMTAGWPAVSRAGTVAMAFGAVDMFETGWRAPIHVQSALGVSDLEGSAVKLLGEGTDPAWSPDGKQLAFSRAVGGRAHVFVTNADGTNERQITAGSDDDIHPSWSPDGQSLVFCSAHESGNLWTQANLFSVRPDGSWLVQLTEGDRIACRPDWAKDGYIYFHANATDRFHIWRILPTGRAEPGQGRRS